MSSIEKFNELVARIEALVPALRAIGFGGAIDVEFEGETRPSLEKRFAELVAGSEIDFEAAAEILGEMTAVKLAAEEALAAAPLVRGYWPSTAAGIGSGIAGHGAITAGTGGTNGTYPLVTSGGGQQLAARGWVLVEGGAITRVQIDHPGYYTGAPTLNLAAITGLTGAAVPLVMAPNTPVGSSFMVGLQRYRVDPGPVAVADGPQIASADVITTESSKNLISIRVGNVLVGAMTADGGFYLPDFPEPLKKYIDRYANLSRISSARAAVEERDAAGALTGWTGRLGNFHLPGLAGDVAGSVRAVMARQRELSARIDSIGQVTTRQAYYHARPSGAIVEYNVLIKRLTAASTRKVNSWVQGKAKANSLGHLMFGHNRASSHGNTDTRAYTQRSEDGGKTWSDAEMVVDGRPGKAADCFAYGIDHLDREWFIIRHRGANNAVGTTAHELFIRVDGVLTSHGELSEITQDGFVPELFHDLTFVGGRMLSFFHFAGSSRVGIISIDATDPATRTYVDVIPHASVTFPAATLVEGTLCHDPVAGKLIGGLRTQSAGHAPRWFHINPDLTGFVMFNAPETVLYNPWSFAIVGRQAFTMSIERFTTGVVRLWTVPLDDFYAGVTANAFSIQLGDIIDTPLVGSSETGVPHLVAVGDIVHFGFSHERADGYSHIYYGNFNAVTPESWITNAKLYGGVYG